MIVLVREKLGKLLENFSRFVVKIINFMRFLWNLWCQGLPLMVGRSTLISSLRLKSIININKCPSLIIVFIFHHWEFLFFPSCAVKLSRGEFCEEKRGKNSNSVQYYNQNTHNLFILSFSRMSSLSHSLNRIFLYAHSSGTLYLFLALKHITLTGSFV